MNINIEGKLKLPKNKEIMTNPVNVQQQQHPKHIQASIVL
jgi:hypothetical protein